VLEIDRPTTRRQFDDVRWYLVHESTFVFIEKRRWYLGVYARCKHLQADNRCGIYEKRPRICREYSTDSCDYHGGEYDWEVLFTSAEQLERYAEQWLRRQKEKRKRQKGSEKRVASSEKKKRRLRKPPRLQVTLLAGGPDRPAKNGNGNGNGHGVSLPVLR
jgi:Fe-S-cluster containining protein